MKVSKLLVTAAAALLAAAVISAPGHADRRHKVVRVNHHGGDWKRAKHDKYGSIQYVTVRHNNAFILRPAREECFVVRRHQALVVQPVPYWSVPYRPVVSGTLGVRSDNLQFDLAFHDRRAHYGCNFCEAYFPSYGSWKRHVVVCRHRPHGRLICEPWADDDMDYFQEPASYACSKYDRDWDDWDDN